MPELGPLGTNQVGKTSEGRPIIRNPDGSMSTERTISGAWGPNGEWVNIPTIYGGREVSEEEAVRIARENNFIDSETGRKLRFYSDAETAVAAAKKRSASIVRSPERYESRTPPEDLHPTAGEDLAGTYAASQRSKAAQELIDRVRRRRAGQPEERPPETTPETGAPDQAPPGGDSAERDAGRAADPDGGGAIAAAATTAIGVLADVGQGVIEVPRAIVGGVRDAVQETLETVDSMAGWLDTHVIDLTPEDAVTIGLPEVGRPETVTGNLVRGVAQFLTGFAGAGKLQQGLRIGRAVTGLGRAGEAAARGAVADLTVFDPHEERLSNLVREHTELRGPVVDFLAADPDDSEAEGRLANAIEGLGLGVVAEGFTLALRSLRASRKAKARARGETDEDPLQSARSAFGEVSDRDFLILGDATAPLFEVRAPTPEEGAARIRASEAATADLGVPSEVAAAGLARSGAEGGEEVFVNFARIGAGGAAGADDIRSVIGQMADAFAGDVKTAQRGRQSNEATQALADELGMTPADLLARRQGQPFNAEEAVAARRLWASSGEKLLETALRASSPNAGAVDQFNFRRMMAVHHAIQAEVIGARTEAARALQSWSIPVGGGVEQAKAISDLMAGMGGPQASAEMAKRLAILAREGKADPATVGKIAAAGWGARSADAVREAWINGLLSSPKTHVVNITSNALVAVQQIAERRVAEEISAWRSPNGVAPGEAAAMAYGLIEAQKDAWRMAWIALRSGSPSAPLVSGGAGGIGSKLDLPGRDPRTPAISSSAFNLNAAGPVGRTVDLLGVGARVPGRLLESEDAFFKTIGYRMELHAQALRQATSEGLEGEALARRARELIDQPPEHIRIAAADQALYQTFTNAAGWFGQRVMRLRGESPLNPMFLILPFVRTPVNIARYSFERIPGINLLVRQWREDVAAGGARQDIALARIATGTSLMLLAADLASNGIISGRGPEEQGEREVMLRQGWQPYSFKAGDRWYSYNRTDPLGMTLGFAADIAEAMRRGEIDEEDVDEWQEVAAMGIATISQVTINKTYMSGMAEFMEMLSNPRSYSRHYITDLASSFTPMPSFMRAVETAVDPALREESTPAEAIYGQIAGLSQRLYKRRDLWGQEIRSESGLGKTYDFFSPVAARAVVDSPVDAEMQRLRVTQRRIAKRSSFEGVRINWRNWPAVYDTYVRLAGNEAKHPAWQLGAKDFLDAVVSGEHPLAKRYEIRSDGPDGGKASWIKNTIDDFRELARREIMRDPQFKAFQDHVRAKRAEEIEKRRPQIMGQRPQQPDEAAVSRGLAEVNEAVRRAGQERATARLAAAGDDVAARAPPRIT